jgi:erythromycin esterase
MKSNLVPFETDIPTTLELRPLVGMLQSAQLLGLGESTHGDHQSQVFKSQLIRRLIADQGLQQVVFEINRSAGQALDDYVNKGQGDFADVIRNDGVFKIWQTDDFASLIAWMRAYVKKTGRSIRVYGIDCQMPGKDLSTVVSFLKKVDPRTADQTAKTYRSLFDADSQGKTYFAWLKSRSKSDYPVYSKPAAALEQLLETNKASWCKVAGFDDAVYAARTAFQAFNAFELDFGGLPSDMSKYNALYLSRRDRFMAQNVLWRIGNNRACLWAHNGHVLGRPGDATLGSLLSAKLGAKYVTVGFTWSQGVIHVKSVSGSSVDLVALQNAAFPQVALNANRSGDLGEFLGRLGYDRFYIDLRRADEGTKKWGKVPYYLPSIGWLFNPRGFLGDVNQASPTIPSYDILVYSRKISPSTLWFP